MDYFSAVIAIGAETPYPFPGRDPLRPKDRMTCSLEQKTINMTDLHKKQLFSFLFSFQYSHKTHSTGKQAVRLTYIAGRTEPASSSQQINTKVHNRFFFMLPSLSPHVRFKYMNHKITTEQE